MSGKDATSETMIEQTRRRVEKTRRLYYDQSMDGGISRGLHLELAKRVLEYDDVLSEFKTADGVNYEDFPDISNVKHRMGRQTEVISDSARLGEKRTTKSVPAVVEIPPTDLVAMTKQLDKIAQDLGFGADLDTDQPGGIR